MLKIVRGRIYHNILDELIDLVFSLFVKFDDENKVKEFEQKFASRVGAKYAKTMPFARYALYEILRFKNFPKGSEIIMPPITIKPMVDIVLMAGLKPVFVDIEPNTLCCDINKLKKEINKNTKAISITYLFGIVPNMDDIISICRKNNLFIIEDFSHSLNAQYKGQNIGTFGDVSIYSSSSLKTVDTYIGGTVFTNDKNLYLYLENIVKKLPKMPRIFLIKKILLNLVRNVFSKSIIFTFIINPLLNIIKKVNYSLYQRILGARLNLKPVKQMPVDWTYKFTSIQARRGLKQLDKVDLVDNEKIKNVKLFKRILGEENWDILPKEIENTKNVYWQYPIYIDNVEEFIEYMSKNGVDMGLTNLSLCSHLDIYPEYKRDTPNAYNIKNHYVFVPTYQGLNEEHIKTIAKLIKKFLEKS